MSHDSKRPVTLEDLLRLKRAERPPPEFWEQFDRELRVKQLAALVEKRPWWRGMPTVSSGWRRLQLPLGAAAVLALTFVTVRDFSTTAEQPAPAPVRTAGNSPAVVHPIAPAADEANTLAASTDSAPAVNAPAESSVLIAPANDTESMAPAGNSPVLPLLAGTFEATPATAETSPSARSIAANLAALESVAPAMVGGLLSPARESRGLVARAVAVEPLQQMTPPSEVRLARYRSPLVAMSAEETDRTGERIARRISGDRLYEQIGRISGRGDRVNLKF